MSDQDAAEAQARPRSGGGPNLLARAWGNFSTGGRLGDASSPLIRKVKFLNYYLFVTVFVCLVFGPINMAKGLLVPGGTELAIGLVGVGMLLYVRRTERVDRAQVFTLLYAILLMIVLLFTGGIEKTGIFWWYCIPPGAFFLTGRRRGWWWVLATMGILAADMILIALGRIQGPYTVVQLRQFAISYLVIAIIMYFYEIVRDDYARVIERKTEEALQTNARLTVEVYERQKAQGALEAAKQEAERANSAKSEFLSRMSHELRTPMNSILGFSQLLETDTAEPLGPSQRESVSQILASGRHLLSLINEVLDLARIEAGRLVLEPQPVAIAPLVADALAAVKPLADPRGIALRDESGGIPGLAAVADPHRLKQVLLNLLSNAIKYNRDGGLVVVQASQPAPGSVRLGVTDTGDGISPEKQALVFEPFQRLAADHSSVEGTGIGLTIVKKLVETMSGHISVTSTPGLGSCFAVDLPAAEKSGTAMAGAVAPPALLEAGAPGVEGTVLYVEDDAANLTLVKHLLNRRSGVRLIQATTGAGGIEMARAHRPGLILLDIHLPDMDGHEVFRKLRESEETAGVPVVVVSASAMPNDVERLLSAGVDRYLTKPLDVKVFLQTVDELIGKTGGGGT